MNIKKHTLNLLLLLLASFLVTACSEQVSATKVEPALVEAIAGSEFNRVTLTEKANERLGIELDEIRQQDVDGAARMVVPYNAILYGLNGETWVYTQIGELAYARAPITIDYIEGDMVVLTDGPELGTPVVTIGVAELYGTDTGVGK